MYCLLKHFLEFNQQNSFIFCNEIIPTLVKYIFFTKYLLKKSQWTLATIIQDYAVKNRTRNKVILAPGNAQNAGFYTI